MRWIAVVSALSVCSGGGVTKNSGVSQFWTDDYKVFEQVYGKTSDKELYGDSLPPAISYGIQDLTKFRPQASEKNERYIDTDEETPVDPYAEDAYSRFLSKQSLKDTAKKIQAFKGFEKSSVDFDNVLKPTKPSYKFYGYSDFKPISKSNDPETYEYLKHLDQLDSKQNLEYHEGVTGFYPYYSTAPTNIRETDPYKSIQDILDAHESNKGKNKKRKQEEEDDVKYLNYGASNYRGKSRLVQSNYITNPRCRSGRCRKRSTYAGRPRSRPVVRTVKHRFVTTH